MWKRPDCFSWCLFKGNSRDSVEKIRLPSRCLLQRDSRDSAVGGKLFQPASVPKKHLENSAEKAGLFQPMPVPKRFPGAVQEEADCPRQSCSEEITGTGQTGGISSEASAWGQQPADTRTEKHPEGHRAFRVFCYVREITSSGRFQTTAESPSGGAAGAGACPTGTAHGFRP